MTQTIEDIFNYQKTDATDLTFIQIGTNDGNDYFNKICQKYKPQKLILIEPHKHLNESIKNAYRNLNPKLINCAITDNESSTEIKMFNVNSPQHSSILPLKDWNKEIQTTIVPAKTLKAVLNEQNINKVNLLYIDTEGFDSFIINSIFKNNLHNNFDVIVFEHWGFSPSDYDTPNELQGLEGLKNIEKLAETNNFLFADFQADGDKSNDNHVIYKKI
jgi:FkbM family methyltransferase